MHTAWTVDNKREDPKYSLFCANVDTVKHDESFHIRMNFPLVKVYAVGEGKYDDCQKTYEWEKYLNSYTCMVHLKLYLGSIYYLNVHNDSRWHQENACKEQNDLHREP